MFPTPQSALPLPPRPNLERYKKLAKELVRVCKTGTDDALENWADRWIRALAKSTGWASPRRMCDQTGCSPRLVVDFVRRKLSTAEPGTRSCSLTGAQFVIARLHGFNNWPKFSRHLEELARKSSSDARFEAAADAIVSGDLATLKRLLHEDPQLVHARSTREHGATLLHYVSANGVESYRQKTPKNIVKITQILLNTGSEINATASVYGGDCTTLGLAATSEPPERAGVQEALLETLLDHDANPAQPSSAGNQQSLIHACLANGRLSAARFFADRGMTLNLAEAAALGEIDVVKTFFKEDGRLKSPGAGQQLRQGFLFACAFGQIGSVKFLLDKDVDLAAHNGDGQTALHWAVIGGHLEIIKLLLLQNAPLELKNIYGGTVLGQALWSAAHGGDPDAYISILEALVAAGSYVPARHAPIGSLMDRWLADHGSHVEPSWDWS